MFKVYFTNELRYTNDHSLLLFLEKVMYMLYDTQFSTLYKVYSNVISCTSRIIIYASASIYNGKNNMLLTSRDVY